MRGNTKYLVPSTLGVGLVDGYDSIEYEQSFSKPDLRRDVGVGIVPHQGMADIILAPQTERDMVRICERQKTKAQVLQENTDRYREMYVRARNEFLRIANVRAS